MPLAGRGGDGQGLDRLEDAEGVSVRQVRERERARRRVVADDVLDAQGGLGFGHRGLDGIGFGTAGDGLGRGLLEVTDVDFGVEQGVVDGSALLLRRGLDVRDADGAGFVRLVLGRRDVLVAVVGTDGEGVDGHAQVVSLRGVAVAATRDEADESQLDVVAVTADDRTLDAVRGVVAVDTSTDGVQAFVAGDNSGGGLAEVNADFPALRAKAGRASELDNLGGHARGARVEERANDGVADDLEDRRLVGDVEVFAGDDGIDGRHVRIYVFGLLGASSGRGECARVRAWVKAGVELFFDCSVIRGLGR